MTADINVTKIPTHSKAKSLLGATILRMYGIKPVFTNTGHLTKKSRDKITEVGYYWSPSLATWVFRPELGNGDKSRERFRPGSRMKG